MTPELVTEASRYQEAFRQATQTRAADEPSWLQTLRESSFAEFERAGFPNVKQEEWKYTNVTPITRADFVPVLTANGTALSKGAAHSGLAPFIYDEARDSRLVFVNGMFREELSSKSALPAGVVAMDLRAALRLRLAVELPTGHVIDAPLTGVGREVALDRLSRGAGPRVLGRRAGTCLLGLLRLGVRRSGLAGEAILIVGAFRAVAGVPAHVASRI